MRVSGDDAARAGAVSLLVVMMKYG